jgi:hypothetical protein
MALDALIESLIAVLPEDVNLTRSTQRIDVGLAEIPYVILSGLLRVNETMGTRERAIKLHRMPDVPKAIHAHSMLIG